MQGKRVEQAQDCPKYKTPSFETTGILFFIQSSIILRFI